MTFLIEYEPVPEHYPGCSTIEEMAEVDRLNYERDPGLALDGGYEVEVRAEVVEVVDALHEGSSG